MHNTEESVQLHSSASSTKTPKLLWQALWWMVAVLAAISVGLWLYIWWRWQRADPTSPETWHVLISAIVPLMTGLLGWLNARMVSPDGPSVLVVLVDNLLNSIIQRWRALFYRKDYLAYLIGRVYDYDTADLTIQSPVTLAAEQIYVEPHLKVSPVHTIAPAVLDPHEQVIDEQCHSIWHYLRHAQLRSTVGPRPLVLLGGPGYGKSALLRHIAHVVSSNRQTRKRYLAPRKLPMLLRLRVREVEKLVTNTPINTANPADSYSRDYTLPQAITDNIYTNGGPHPPQDWFSRQLRKGDCIVLLDGLDEIPDPLVQAQVMAWLNQQRRAFYRNQFLLTSRPLAYQDTPLEGATTIAIMPLAANQIRELIQRWYRAVALTETKEMTHLIERTVAQQTQGLIHSIGQSPALLRLAQNPLLLTMILHVYTYKKDALPEKRVTLLNEAFVVLLKRREQREHAENDQDTRTKNAQIEKIIAEYEQQQRQYQAQEKERHVAIDSRTSAENKQIRDAISHYEHERERLRNAERQQINAIKQHYDPFYQETNNAVKALTHNQSEQVNAETIAHHRANRCTEFPDTIAKPLKTALNALDDFAQASQEFFSDADSLAIAAEQMIKQVMTETDELVNFLNEIASSVAADVIIYQQALANIQQTLLTAQSIIRRRDQVKAMLTVVYDSVENGNLEPLADSTPLDRINRHLRVTIDEIQGYLSTSHRKLNLQADVASALQRLAYMRLLLLTSALCLLDATKGERHNTTVITRLLEQYMKLIFIEERMRGVVPAYEGLRLIKEYIAKPLA